MLAFKFILYYHTRHLNVQYSLTSNMHCPGIMQLVKHQPEAPYTGMTNAMFCLNLCPFTVHFRWQRTCDYSHFAFYLNRLSVKEHD